MYTLKFVKFKFNNYFLLKNGGNEGNAGKGIYSPDDGPRC